MSVARKLEDQLRQMTPVSAPTDQQAEVAKLSLLLETLAHGVNHSDRVCKLVGPRGETIVLPEFVFAVLERVAEVLARGDAITVVPIGKELTTQQAADLLSVSRQYLVRLLDERRIPYTKTGKHRRLRIEDVLAFRDKRDASRHGALQDLTRLTEEFGGYDREMK